MDRRLCFVVLLVLAAISWCCSAKDLAAADLKRDVSEKQVQGGLCTQCKELVTTYSDEQKQKEIINRLHGFCNSLGVFNIMLAQQCTNNVDQVLPNLFEFISSSTPETICKGFCEGVVSISQYASTEKQVQVSANEDQCSKCKELVTTYSDKQKQSQMINGLHNYCYGAFHELAQQCITQFEPFLTNIFEMINSSTPENLCKWLQYCEGDVMEAVQQLKNPDTQVEVLQMLL